MNLSHATKTMGGILLMGAFCFIASPLSATTYLYDFSNPTGDLGSSIHVYSSNAVNVTASGFSSAHTTIHLYGKHDGGDENGVGLVGTADHEITGSGFIQLDITNLKALNATNYQITIGSSTGSDSWQILGATTSGEPGTTVLAQGTAEGAFSIIPGSFNLITIKAPTGDILLTSLTAQTVNVPEPATMLLLGSSFAMAACRRRLTNRKNR